MNVKPIHRNFNFGKILLVSIALFFSGNCFSQLTELEYFSDTTSGYLDYVYDFKEMEDGIILAGRKEKNGIDEPCVVKINTNGEVVWSTLNQVLLNSDCDGFNFEVFEDGYLYGTSYDVSSSSSYKTNWKIDPTDGTVIWTTDFYPIDICKVEYSDYDSTSYLVAYLNSQENSSIALMSKANGDTIRTKSFLETESTYNIAVDNNKNIYYSLENTLKKFNLNQFDTVLWERTYLTGINQLDVIHKLYLDRYDDIYLMGRDGGSFGHGDGIVYKINNSTGFAIWNQKVYQSDANIIDFRDFQGNLYLTYRHSLVSAVDADFNTAKLSKQTGTVVWSTEYNHTPLGSPASHSGSGESAMSMDVDCNGDVYLTGYYGDANYGPEAWGIMKLKNSDGTRLYDLTITEDSTEYDNYSVGFAACVFGNSPIILGHLESIPQPRPYFVALEPVSGNVTQRKFIGSNHQFPSQTLDIINKNDSIYVFKQIGKSAVLQKYDSNHSLIWETDFSRTNYITFGGQIKVTSNHVYLTSYVQPLDSIYPYYTNTTQSINVYKLDKLTGTILNTDSILIPGNIAFPFELEADNNEAYMFYSNNDTSYIAKFSNVSISLTQLLEPSNTGLTYKGEINIAFNETASNLIYASSDALYSIDKTSLSTTQLFDYSNGREYFSILPVGDTIYLTGSDSLNNQIITSINRNLLTLNWEQQLGGGGSIYKLIHNNSGLFGIGKEYSRAKFFHISDNGTLIWDKYSDSVNYVNTTPLDIASFDNESYISIVGTGSFNAGRTDGLITVYNVTGDTLFTSVLEDELEEMSFANSIEQVSDSTIWIGGALNRITYSKQGFVYLYEYNLITTLIQESLPDNYTELKISPNPFLNKIKLLGLSDEPFVYSVFDITGKLFANSLETDKKEIELSGLGPGIYFISVNQNGNHFVGKILKME